MIVHSASRIRSGPGSGTRTHASLVWVHGGERPKASLRDRFGHGSRLPHVSGGRTARREYAFARLTAADRRLRPGARLRGLEECSSSARASRDWSCGAITRSSMPATDTTSMSSLRWAPTSLRSGSAPSGAFGPPSVTASALSPASRSMPSLVAGVSSPVVSPVTALPSCGSWSSTWSVTQCVGDDALVRELRPFALAFVASHAFELPTEPIAQPAVTDSGGEW